MDKCFLIYPLAYLIVYGGPVLLFYLVVLIACRRYWYK